MTESILILFLIAAIAFFYSSVGHGGASGYLAALSLVGVELAQIRSSALILNIFVAGISFYQFYKAGYFSWKLFYPFALTALPMAYLGSFVELDPTLYKQILGVCLLLAVARMLGLFNRNKSEETRQISLAIALPIGAVLGFVSGVIGIGGGIFLSPIILLFNWGNLKQTAAVSSLFIVVNSLAGLAGMIHQKTEFNSQLLLWVAIAVLAGFCGAYWGSKKVDNKNLKHVLAVVLFVAAVKLIVVP